MIKQIYIVFILCFLSACSIQQKPAMVTTDFCCDANDNCAPAPPAPGVCPADTITTVCDEDNNCVDEE